MSGSLQSTSWASEHYDITPNNVTRGLFLRYLIGNNLDWIGLDRNNRDIKVLDYGAGTGFLSHVGSSLWENESKLTVT